MRYDDFTKLDRTVVNDMRTMMVPYRSPEQTALHTYC